MGGLCQAACLLTPASSAPEPPPPPLSTPLCPSYPLQGADGQSTVEQLFGLRTSLRLVCEESGEELQVRG